MKRSTAIVTAAILTIFGSTAHAASSSYSLLSNLTIRLYDLDTNDGITPSISFSGYSGFGTDSQYVSQATPFGSGSTISTTATSFSVAMGTGAGISLVQPDLITIQGSLYAAGGTDVKAGTGDISTAGSFSGANWENRFSLSANTLVEFTANGIAFSTVYNSPDSTASTHEYSSAWTRLVTAKLTSTGDTSDIHEYFIASYGNKFDQGSAGLNSGLMTASLQNNSSATLNGMFSAGVLANSYYENIVDTPIPSIPEPPTALLFVAGAYTVGRISRRNKN